MNECGKVEVLNGRIEEVGFNFELALNQITAL